MERLLNEKWLQEKEWDCLVLYFSKEAIQTILPLYTNRTAVYSVRILPEQYENIYENRALTLFLVYFFPILFGGIQVVYEYFVQSELIQRLFAHPKWQQEYKDDVQFQIAFCSHYSRSNRVDPLVSFGKNLLTILPICPSIFEIVDAKWSQDRKVVLEVIKADGSLIEYADQKFYFDRELLLIAAETQWTDDDSKHSFFTSVIPQLKDDVEYLKVLVLRVSCGIFEHFPQTLFEDRELVLKIVKQTPLSLFFFQRTEWIYDEEVSMAAVTYHGDNFQYLPLSMKEDKRFQLAALQSCSNVGDVLLYFPMNEITKEVALVTVKSTRNALSKLPSHLAEDIDVVLEAVKYHATALWYASKQFKTDAELVKQILKRNGECLEYIDCNHKDSKEFALVSVEQNAIVYNKRWFWMRDDVEVFQRAMRFYDMFNQNL